MFSHFLSYSYRKYNQFFKLPKDEKFTYKIIPPEIDEGLKNKITRIAPLDKIIMICPHTQFMPLLEYEFWEKLIESLNAKGYEVITNAMNPKRAIVGASYIDMTVKETIELAYNCHAVYAIRSGLCDLFVGLRDRLHVFYPEEEWYNYASFKTNYNIHDIEEMVINIDKIKEEL